MKLRSSRLVRAGASFVFVLLAACAAEKSEPVAPLAASPRSETPAWAPIGKQPAVPNDEGVDMPDFFLEDVNPNSASAGQFVSPRYELRKVSTWYFGHAT